jgi:hypothetical protein
MVLSHATEEGAGDAARNAAAAAANQSKSLMSSLKGLVAKKPSQAAA